MTTETIDKLFLELSQVTTAKTARELRLEALLQEVVADQSEVQEPHLIHRIMEELK